MRVLAVSINYLFIKLITYLVCLECFVQGHEEATGAQITYLHDVMSTYECYLDVICNNVSSFIHLTLRYILLLIQDRLYKFKNEV